jgi:hypothetical protein
MRERIAAGTRINGHHTYKTTPDRLAQAQAQKTTREQQKAERKTK